MEFYRSRSGRRFASADTTRPAKSDTHTRMRVLKRNGTYEPADLNTVPLIDAAKASMMWTQSESP